MEYWIWLSLREKIGSRGAVKLLEAFGTAKAVFLADRTQLIHTPGVSPVMLPSLLDKDLTPAKKVLSDCLAQGIRIMTLHDEMYPSSLRVIGDPPVVLYLYGAFPPLEDRPVIGIVGARRASAYGLSTAEYMGYNLHAGGCTVVSGMAKGIDGAAMRGALKSGNRVIAVLGCGVDRLYPRENQDIYSELRTCGCIISEYPPGTAPLPENFPPRNRIISGLSDGVLVVEAAKNSGSLITAEFALEQNRDLFAIPGNIGLSTCEGSNRLLKNGAELVQTPADILQAYLYRYPEVGGLSNDGFRPEAVPEKTIDIDKAINYIDLKEISEELPNEAITLLKVLGTSTLTMDELIEASGVSAGKVLGMTTLLEVKGYLQRLAGNHFCRIR